LRSPQRLIDKVMTRKQVDSLLETSYRLRALGAEVGALAPNQEVVIEIEKHRDGTLLVLPAPRGLTRSDRSIWGPAGCASASDD